MLRDMKLFRRNSSKKPNSEEIENVPINPTDASGVQTGADSMRPPLNTIEPSQNPKTVTEQEVGSKRKADRTPSKGKGANVPWGLRTPEKQGVGSAVRNKFGWAQRNELGGEMRDEGKSDVMQFPRGGGIGTGGLTNMTPRSVRSMGRATSAAASNQSECSSTQSTPTKSVTKPPYTGLGHSCRPPVNTGGRGGNFGALSKGIPVSCVSPLVVNTVEVPHFELREDPSFWMDHNVQVLIRVRPLNTMEKSLHGYNRCLKQDSAQSIAWIGQPETRFTFDHVACETVNQEMLFRVAGLPMVENCLSGYNSCMFAYGQTGSGKTHTMLGEIDELEVKPSPDRGMTPRIFEFLFARIRAEEESRRDENLKYYCKCSFLEIYNEQITDLLDPSSTNLLLREDIKNGVYVENLTELEVQTVNDILRLLTEGAANRRVAATNMNRESSRSHSVFTCVIESRWEKDSTTNLRFARLNLVDLAGSERQKTSGAEGERLKEAANINKSLSTLGHVIMLLVDVAHGKQRHIPYRDSRLTFLLQESLGGNSKTMIIANVSPSLCCAAETLSTLKFAQRAKLIQNNAIVNEDASGDVIALQHQIRLLKEEVSFLKHRNVSRSLSFCSKTLEDTADIAEGHVAAEVVPEVAHDSDDNSHRSASSGVVMMSTKQLKSLETTLAGALRREKMTDTSMKQLEAEIEQLNRLVHQREEDTRSIKMMLRFREDKIQRMESLVGGFISSDSYLQEENNAFSEELQLLRARADRNPEVTRFALENIRLLDKLRKFQDFYEEGEREMLLAEVSELRDQLLQLLDGNTEPHNHLNLDVPCQLKETHKELEDCRNNLSSCLDINAKLTSEINDLRSELDNLKSGSYDKVANVEPVMAASTDVRLFEEIEKEKAKWKHETTMKHIDEIMNLQLELDIIKIILQEERSSRGEVEKKASCLSSDLEMANERCLQTSMQFEDAENKLKDASSVIEALESQQLLLINELEGLRDNNNHYMELFGKRDQEISILKDQLCSQELRKPPSSEHLESEDKSPLQARVKRMQDSLEKAKKLNVWYQGDRAFQISNEEEMDEIRRQVEAETAEVIVCLQEELCSLQDQVNNYNAKEMETQENLLLLETESKDLREQLYSTTLDKEILGVLLEEKDEELRMLSEEWEKLACEIEVVIADGHEALKDASSQVDLITSSFPQRTWICQQVGRMLRNISEKELMIEELQRSLEEAQNIRIDMDWKLRSLRGATLAITEAQQQESSEKEKEILLLAERLGEKTSILTELEDRIKMREDQVRQAENCATVAFVVVNRLSEVNSDYLDVIKHKDIQLDEAIELSLKKDALFQDQVAVVEEAEKQLQTLRKELGDSEESCLKLKEKLSEEEERACLMERKLAEVEKDFLLKTREKLDEFKSGVSTLSSCMNEYATQEGGLGIVQIPGENDAHVGANGDSDGRIVIKSSQDINKKGFGDLTNDTKNSFSIAQNVDAFSCKQEDLESVRTCKDVSDGDQTILLLRKEIESALNSLRRVEAQMVQLREEKEEIRNSEKQSRKNLECLISQFLTLQEKMSSSEKQSELKLMELDSKLNKLEEVAQEANAYRSQKGEVLELQLNDAQIVAVQKSSEAACLLAKYEEAQETITEADVMVNALMAANDRAKLEIEKLKLMKAALSDERDFLFSEVQSLESSNYQKDQQYDNLERQYCSDLSDTRSLVFSLEDIVTQVQTTYKEEFESMLSDFHCLKTQLMESANVTRSWLEDIWSEIIVKDCAVSVLHLCHMGVLLEAVNGLNAENGLLHHGLCESNSSIENLKQHNSKAKRELEMCRVLKGKLLVDIKSSFDHISKKEDETGKFSARLSSFEKKILDLQLQEESMLARSNIMGSELSLLMKELDLSNTNALKALLDQEQLLKDKEEITNSQVEFMMVDLSAKDLESFILASELQNMALEKADLETEQERYSSSLENMMKDLILAMVESELGKQMLMDKEGEVSLLRRMIEEWDDERNGLSQELQQCSSRLSELEQAKMALEKDVQSLNEVSCSNDKLKSELGEVTETRERLTTQVQVLEAETERLVKDWEMREAAQESEQVKYSSYLEKMSKELILLMVASELEGQMFSETEVEVDLLKRTLEESDNHRNDLSQKLNECISRFSEVEKAKMTLEAEIERLVKDWELKETALKASVCKLQTELSWKDAELNRTYSIEEENKTLKYELTELNADYCRVHDELQEKTSEFASSISHMHVVDQESQRLRDRICSLETCIASIQNDRDRKNEELEELQHSQSIIAENLSVKNQDFEIQTKIMNSLKGENSSLRSELMSVQQSKDALLSSLSLDCKGFISAVLAVNMTENRVFKFLDERNITVVDKMFQDLCENKERASKLIMECERLESFVEQLISENLSFQAELSRKDEVLDGLLFDLSLLQESASNAKDQKDEFAEMVAEMESLEDELAHRLSELDEAVSHGQMLEAQLQEKVNAISALEVDVSKERETLELVMGENVELKSQMQDISVAKSSLEEELREKSKVMERLEEEIFQMDNALGQTNTFLEGLKDSFNEVTSERDHLDSEVLVLKEKLEMAQAVAEETEAIAVEARQIAEIRKTYAEEKEEEVKLLERSVEELECTVDVLENKVDIVKGEAEKQRLQREELEIELQAIRNQMLSVSISGTTIDAESQSQSEAQKEIEILKQNIAEKDAEISQCRVYISELNMHAEAQARDYKQKFKALEAMAEQVKPDPPPSSHVTNSSSTKTEKGAAKPRGSGSPFKCIGLGLAQQMSSEKDEELSAGRHRIEELEALAASRQKEIFMLNTRLAAAESMTHDVIRDLLGVKLDMTNYASLLDHQQVQKITEKARLHSEDSLVKEQEVVKLKQQLNEFIEERQGWLEEINRRQAEMVAARIASEKLRQRDEFLTTENEMLKKENVSHKKKLMELDDEVKKLSGQQNLQQRIHHHAKIKEENNWLKTQNEDMSAKLRQTDSILTRLKEEVACYRASNGRNPFIDFDEEIRLKNNLKETEEERLQLAQKLLSLCTSILKAAGITKPGSDVSLSVAEEALDLLKDRIVSLEREVQDLTFKNKISSERARLSELKQQSTSPLNSRREENCTTPGRTPFLTALSR